ncbi:hypothetical protein [Rivularia sp. UHCC 0363]|uniref:hypothetical protein n=1 Tax=Rivularia sp. UHCC 0363 TaxID=3110244 RepID=UPI002B1F9D56|nr:hypothetical protein [Rivularia sp. UHCC 0363]MEA5593460.1 hypothetical protein [Rivularia sp. UHCC 0363]
MKKSTYTHLPRVNQEFNNNLVTKNMILSKRFNIKSFKNVASCLLSSIVAISILGIANKSVAQNRNERSGFIAVMRLNKNNEFLFIRQEATIVEKVKKPSRNINNEEVEPDLLENIVGKLQYVVQAGKNKFKKHLAPTTIVQLSDCKENGWCRLEKIIENQGNKGQEWENPNFRARHSHTYPNVGNEETQVPLEAWVPSNNFCDIDGNARPLIDCSRQTRDMVEANPEVKGFKIIRSGNQ